jgi:HK97 gp10 family phage protein
MSRQNVDNIGLQLFGANELGQLFDELKPKIQNNIIAGGLKSAGNIILQQAKSNFKTRITSAKGGLKLQQYFKVEQMKSKVGVKVGAVGYNAYLLRFLEYGTKERKYITTKNRVSHFTGVLKASKFFSDAVNDKKDEAMQTVQASIVDSMNKAVAKYSKIL